MSRKRVMLPAKPVAYYQVRGQDGVLRYEALYLPMAEQFATDVYKRERVICTIDEVTT